MRGMAAGVLPWARAAQHLPRKTVLKARTGKRKRGSASIQRSPVEARAPAAMMAVDMAMRAQGVIPGMQDHRAPDLPAEVAASTRHERLARRVEQEGQQRSLVCEDEVVQIVGDGKHQVEIGHREPCRFAVRHPLHRGKGLALRAVPIATGMIRVPFEATGGTVFRVPPALRRPAGFDRVHHLLMCRRYGMGTAVSLTIEAEEIGDFP